MSSATDLGLTVPLYDVSSTVPSYLKANTLFFTPSLERASNNDKKILREKVGITTVVNTRYPERLRYYKHADGSYKSEPCTVEHVLGVTLCRVHLRLGRAFAESLVKKLPVLDRCRLHFKTNMSTVASDPKLVRQGQILMRPPRSRVEDGLAVLIASAGVVGHVFNAAFASPDPFPLLICGRGVPASNDSSLLVFLLLLVLDVPEVDIQRVLDEIDGQLALYDPDKQARRLDTHWTTELKHCLEAKYGQVAGYLRSAGVTQATLDRIREMLVSSQVSEKGGRLIDIEAGQT